MGAADRPSSDLTLEPPPSWVYLIIAVPLVAVTGAALVITGLWQPDLFTPVFLFFWLISPLIPTGWWP